MRPPCRRFPSVRQPRSNVVPFPHGTQPLRPLPCRSGSPAPSSPPPPGLLHQACCELTPEQIEAPIALGKWSPREIAAHLADCELVFSFRLRQTLAPAPGASPAIIQPFDQEAWAQRYAAYDLPAALELFRAARAWNLKLIGSLGEADLNRETTHPERGTLTFQTILENHGRPRSQPPHPTAAPGRRLTAIRPPGALRLPALCFCAFCLSTLFVFAIPASRYTESTHVSGAPDAILSPGFCSRRLHPRRHHPPRPGAPRQAHSHPRSHRPSAQRPTPGKKPPARQSSSPTTASPPSPLLPALPLRLATAKSTSAP